MPPFPTHFLIEGLDRLGKDTLIQGIQNRLGYHQVLHFTKPLLLEYYDASSNTQAYRRYQEDSFRMMFRLLRDLPHERMIFNRAHLGECVYAPMYRSYSGEYVFELEAEFGVCHFNHARLVLLTEDFTISSHFKDDGKSLGHEQQRSREQSLFVEAFHASTIKDKRSICVTDPVTGRFRTREAILTEAMNPFVVR